ncbi:MAG TPA: DUF3887 domain-containing protein [Candidatus Pacearchaeota archaeon]|nr:DUF3887 domain-containing protein [Candidatus Pacearchaeota archaeon]
MKSKNIVIILMVIIGLLILGLSYNEMNKQKDAENIDIEEEVVVTQTREEKVNNFLQALKNSDYEKLSKDFVPQLAEELTYDEMIKLKALLDENWGDLINLNEPEYPDFGEDKIVLDYRKAEFQKESTDILIRFIFDKEDKLTQVFFDSPKLREAISD